MKNLNTYHEIIEYQKISPIVEMTKHKKNKNEKNTVYPIFYYSLVSM